LAYTTPNTVGASDVLTSALWNTQIRDNMEFLYTGASCCLDQTSGTTQTFSNGTVEVVTYAAALWDSDPAGAMWDAGNPTRINIQSDGIYVVNFSAALVCTSAMTNPEASILENIGTGSAIYPRTDSVFGLTRNSGLNVNFNCTFIRRFTAGTYVESRVGSSGSGTININPFSYNQPATFSATKIANL